VLSLDYASVLVADLPDPPIAKDSPPGFAAGACVCPSKHVTRTIFDWRSALIARGTLRTKPPEEPMAQELRRETPEK
jgi:hypothetical protein